MDAAQQAYRAELEERLKRAENLVVAELRKADEADTRATASSGHERTRLEVAAQMHRRAAKLHQEAADLHRLHRQHEEEAEARRSDHTGDDRSS